MNRMKRLTGRKILLATVALCAFGIAKAQNAQAAKDTLTLTLDKALTIALDENPTIKVAAEEIALKKVAGKEAWQSLLPGYSSAAAACVEAPRPQTFHESPGHQSYQSIGSEPDNRRCRYADPHA